MFPFTYLLFPSHTLIYRYPPIKSRVFIPVFIFFRFSSFRYTIPKLLTAALHYFSLMHFSPFLLTLSFLYTFFLRFLPPFSLHSFSLLSYIWSKTHAIQVPYVNDSLLPLILVIFTSLTQDLASISVFLPLSLVNSDPTYFCLHLFFPMT